ncbi:hypothetical protein BDV12DRAFT_106124 [Aspergillus spectabilis]
MASSTVNSAPVASSPPGNASVQNTGSRPSLRPSVNPKSVDGSRRQTGSPLDGGQRYVVLSYCASLALPNLLNLLSLRFHNRRFNSSSSHSLISFLYLHLESAAFEFHHSLDSEL